MVLDFRQIRPIPVAPPKKIIETGRSGGFISEFMDAFNKGQEFRLRKRGLDLQEKQIGIQERKMEASQKARAAMRQLVTDNPGFLDSADGLLKMGQVLTAEDPQLGLQFINAGQRQKRQMAQDYMDGKRLELQSDKLDLEERKFEAASRGGTSATSTFGKLLQDRRLIQNELRNLDPTSPDYDAKQQELALIDSQVAKQNADKKSGVTVNVGDDNSFSVPSGFMLRDPKNPGKGIQPIPGGPADKQTVESASKTAAIELSRKQIPEIEKLLFNEDGSINRKNLRNSSISLPFTNTKGIPFTKGSELATRMEVGIQAITRAETGAAMPPEEVENTRKRFQPGALDSDNQVKIKLEMFKDFLNGSLKLIRPDGKFNAERFEDEFLSRQQAREKAAATPPAPSKPQPSQFLNQQTNPAVQDFIGRARQGGFTDEQIEEHLRKKGLGR